MPTYRAPPTQYINARSGLPVAFDYVGDSRDPAIVCIPGMGDLRSQYRHLRPYLVQCGLRVITFDVRGFGDSAPRFLCHAARAVAKDAMSILDLLRIEQAFFVGHAFGGEAALWAAKDFRHRVLGVILLAPILRDLPVPVLTKHSWSIGFTRPWRVRWYMTHWDKMFQRRPRDHEQQRLALQKNLRERGRMTTLWDMINTPKKEVEGIVCNHRGPILIFMGSKDPHFPKQKGEADMMAELLRSEMHPIMVDGVGHYPHVEVPQRLVRQIIQFTWLIEDGQYYWR